MKVTIVFRDRGDDRLIARILSHPEVGVGGMAQIGEILETDYGAKVLRKLEGPADEHIWDLAIGGQGLKLMYDPMTEFDIAAKEPSDNDLVRRIGEDLKGRFRKMGVLRERGDPPTG